MNRPASLLSQQDLIAIKSALQSVVATFFTKELIIRHRTNVGTAQFGEKSKATPQDFVVKGLYEFTKSDGGKYHTLKDGPTGQTTEDGWRFYLWKDEVDALVTVNPQVDKVVLDGHEYIIRFWSPSALFSDLGDLLYELEIAYDTAPLTAMG